MNKVYDLNANSQIGDNTGFINKVYFFMAIAMASSGLGVFVTMFYFLEEILLNSTLLYIIFAVEIGLVLTAGMWMKKRPLNYVLFFLFPFLSGVTVTPLIALFIQTMGGFVMLKAIAATFFIFLGVSLFGATTQRNLVKYSGIMTIMIIGLFVVSIFGIFVQWGSLFELFFSGIGILVFTGYIAISTQSLKHYRDDQYLEAALQLYLNLFNLFIFILRFILAMNRR
jgi:FtsH-binding integral membrane protein